MPSGKHDKAFGGISSRLLILFGNMMHLLITVWKHMLPSDRLKYLFGTIRVYFEYKPATSRNTAPPTTAAQHDTARHVRPAEHLEMIQTAGDKVLLQHIVRNTTHYALRTF
jgi:hypothetical protein